MAMDTLDTSDDAQRKGDVEGHSHSWQRPDRDVTAPRSAEDEAQEKDDVGGHTHAGDRDVATSKSTEDSVDTGKPGPPETRN